MGKLKYFGLILTTTLLMASSFPVGKIALSYSPPFLMTGIRFLFAGLLLAAIVYRREQPRGIRQWGQVFLIGTFQSAGVMGCCYFSMRWITASESTILTMSSPLFVIVLGALLTGAAYRFSQWLGVVAGFAGIVVSFGAKIGWQPGTFIGVAGAVCFAVATLLIKRWGRSFDMTVLAAYQMLAGGAILLLLSLIAEQPRFLFASTSVAAILWLAVMGSIVQFTLWFYLLRHADPAKTSAFLFLVPIFGVFISRLMLGDPLHSSLGAGGALICAGIYLVNREGVRHAAPRRGTNPALSLPTKNRQGDIRS